MKIPEHFRDEFILVLTKKGSLGFWETDDSLIAYFPAATDLEELKGVVKTVSHSAGLQERIEFSYALVPDYDWNESWKKSFTALEVGQRFLVLPPWEAPNPSRINLVIDPGMAFGTGHHETTRSCLVLMEKYDGQVCHGRFLDLGAGTGLLAIAASKLGYQEVVAVDTDPLATEATRANARLNRVDNVDVRKGSISEAAGSFDCITANIISGVLIMLASQIADRLKPSGIAILSGILAEQADEVIEEMEKAGLKLKERYPDDKWASLVMNF